MTAGYRLAALLIVMICLGTGFIFHAAPAAAADTKPAAADTALDEGPSPGLPGTYYDFPDVLIPREMDLVREESFVYDTPTLSAGLLVFTGRVKVKSLSNFFIQSMSRDNWLLGARFTSPKVVQLYEKDNRRALIVITESTFTTRVEVWVAPYLGSGR